MPITERYSTPSYRYRNASGQEVVYGDPTINRDALRGATFVGSDVKRPDGTDFPDPLGAGTTGAGTGAGTPATGSGASVLGGTGGTNPLASVIERYKLENSPEEQAKREATIREETARQRKAQIDAIETVFSAKRAREEKLGEERLASQRSLNLRAGLGGSDFGAAEKDKRKVETNEVVAAVEAEKAAEIGNIIRTFEGLATQRVESDVNRRRQNASDQIAMTEKIVNMAVDQVKSLGKSGINLAALKSRDPQLYQTIRDATGKSDLEIDSILNENLPDALKIKYSSEKIALPNGNAGLLKYGLDPKTGEVTKQTYDLGIKYEALNGMETKEVDGILYKIDRATGTLSPLTQQSEKSKLETDLKREQIATEKAQRENIYSQIRERKNKAVAGTFKPTSQEKSAVMRYAGKQGKIDPKTQNAIDTDPAFFYSLLEKAINDQDLNKTPFGSTSDLADVLRNLPQE